MEHYNKPTIETITEQLRRFRELESEYDLWRMQADGTQLLIGFPQEGELLKLRSRLEDVAIYADLVRIDDRELQNYFNQFRLRVFTDLINKNGHVVCDGLFWDMAEKYHPNKYITEWHKIRPILLMNEAPVELAELFREARECYCLRLPRACVSVCRTLVERSVVDIITRCNKLPEAVELSELGISDRLNLLFGVNRIKSGGPVDRVRSFIKKASEVIHSNKIATQADAFETLRNAQNIVQELYGLYKSEFKF